MSSETEYWSCHECAAYWQEALAVVPPETCPSCGGEDLGRDEIMNPSKSPNMGESK